MLEVVHEHGQPIAAGVVPLAILGLFFLMPEIPKQDTLETAQHTSDQTEAARVIARALEQVFQVASVMLKGMLSLFALVKTGQVAMGKDDSMKDFAFVVLAMLLYFMLPFMMDLATQIAQGPH